MTKRRFTFKLQPLRTVREHAELTAMRDLAGRSDERGEVTWLDPQPSALQIGLERREGRQGELDGDPFGTVLEAKPGGMPDGILQLKDQQRCDDNRLALGLYDLGRFGRPRSRNVQPKEELASAEIMFDAAL